MFKAEEMEKLLGTQRWQLTSVLLRFGGWCCLINLMGVTFTPHIDLVRVPVFALYFGCSK